MRRLSAPDSLNAPGRLCEYTDRTTCGVSPYQSSFPRTREPRPQALVERAAVPACAGMTIGSGQRNSLSAESGY